LFLFLFLLLKSSLFVGRMIIRLSAISQKKKLLVVVVD